MNFGEAIVRSFSDEFWWKYLTEIAVCVLAFASCLRRRKMFWLRLGCGLVAYAAVSSLLRGLLMFAAFRISMYLCWSIAFVVMSLLVLLCFAHRFEDALFCTAAGYALQNGCSTLSKLIWFIPEKTLIRFSELFIVLVVAAATWFLVRRFFERNRDIRFGYVQIVSISLLMLLVASVMSYMLPSRTPAQRLISVILQLSVNVLILLILFSGVRIRRLRSEQILIQRIVQKEGEYYNQMRDYVKVVDLHCHNLRQLVNTVRASGAQADEKLLGELTDAAALYGNMPATNNSAMNLVLADKVVYCTRHNIRFSYQIDGEHLKGISNGDVVILFNNILYNAIEYLSKLEEEKRILSLIVAKKGGFLYIHSENYFEGSVKMEEGVPVTTKEDKDSHGFGMKSIRFIVEKYGGTLAVGTDNNLFSINILIPEDKKGEAFANGKKAPQN